jgi:hypothetical protein
MTARRVAAVLPGIGASLLPKLTCPLCWPAYAGVLTSLGLGFLISARYMLMLTAGFLLVSVGALAFGARQRRGYGPVLGGVISACLVLTGKFYLESSATIYAGIALLLAASVWNIWPKRTPLDCPKCACAMGDSVRLHVKENHETKN